MSLIWELLGLDRFIGERRDCSDRMEDDRGIDFVSSSLLDDEDRRRYVVVLHSFEFAETTFGFFEQGTRERRPCMVINN